MVINSRSNGMNQRVSKVDGSADGKTTKIVHAPNGGKWQY